MAEQIVRTIKKKITETLLHDGRFRLQAVYLALFGYRRRSARNLFSPFQVMYGVSPRFYGTESPGPLILHNSGMTRGLVLLVAGSKIANKIETASKKKNLESTSPRSFRRRLVTRPLFPKKRL